MTPRSRTDWTMVDELVARAGTHTPDYVDEVLAATARVRQRPAWTFPSHWLPAGVAEPHPLLRYGFVLVLLGLALVAGLLAWAAMRPPQPTPRLTGNGVIVWGVTTEGYAAVKNGGAEVGAIDPETGAVPTLSDGHLVPAAFLPDGSRLVFFVAADRGAARRLYASDPDGSDMALLAEYPARDVTSFSSSPDCRWVVASGRPDETSATQRIAVFATDGSGMHILDVGGLSAWHPSWAPTSDRIVFAGESADGSRSLYTIPIDGSARPAPLVDLGADTSPYGIDPEPAWSPDGNWIAYVRNVSGDRVPPVTAVHLVRPDGSEDHALAVPAGWSSRPQWSPDGRSLLVRSEIGTIDSCVDPSAPGCGEWVDREAHLLIVPVHGAPAYRVGPSSTGLNFPEFAWSPDGRLIVALVDVAADVGERGAALINVATNTWRVIVQPNNFGPVSFSWQPVATPAASPVDGTPGPTPSATRPPELVISGRITDPRGEPVADARVSTDGTDQLLARTDGDGAFSIRLASPGTYRLRVAPIAGRLDHPVYFGPAGWTMNSNPQVGSLWSWAESAVVDLVLPDATRVSGTFVDADGAPYRNARIDAISPDTEPPSGVGTLTSIVTQTDDEGHFSLLVMPGRWDLMVDGGDYQGIVDQVTVGAEPVTGLVITRARQP